MSKINGGIDLPDEARTSSVRAALSRVRFVMVETTHPGNIGAVARAMKAMGIEDLSLVAPKDFPSAQATARAAGADDLLASARVFERLEDAIADCDLVVGTSVRKRHISWPALSAEQCAATALEHGVSRAAFVFGRESSGLRNEELDLCSVLMTIPTEPDFRSLNVAAAAQLTAYELRRHAAAPDGGASLPLQELPATDSRINACEFERLIGHFERALVTIGYLDPAAPKLLMRRLRRLFARAGLLKSELNILRGILSALERTRR